MSAVSASAEQLAAPVSTYDDYASCADRSADASAQAFDESGDLAALSDDCPAPRMAAVLDCTDSRTDAWMGGMIGTCDMPKVRARNRVPTLRANATPSSRHPDLFGADDGQPQRAPTRSRSNLESAIPALASASLSRPAPVLRPPADVLLAAHQALGSPLERPPRCP